MTGPRFNPALTSVPAYVPGRAIREIKEQLGLDEVIKLASNESPIGPSLMAVEAAKKALPDIHRYPGTAAQDLQRKLADMRGPGLTEKNFLIGNGGADILRMIAQAFVFDGGNVVMSRVTFPLYYMLTTIFGGEARRVDPRADYSHDLRAMADAIDEDTRLVFLCSPNNPTGHIITQKEADAFLKRVPEHVVVVFDEAYHNFVDDPDYANSMDYVREGRNVLILRSFSKTSGLANLRVGYLVGPTELVDYVRHARLPFHTSDVALAAASASLDDVDYHKRHREAVAAGCDFFCEAFAKLNLTFLAGHTNFVAIINPPLRAPDLIEALLQRGFIVRPMNAFGISDAVRITVGTPEENRKFVVALEGILEEHKLIDRADKVDMVYR